MKKLLSLFAFFAIVDLATAQAKDPVCPFECSNIPITRYAKGMRFYFPADNALKALNKPLPRNL